MEPSKAITSPVVERWSFIMPKRIAIDSTFGLKDKIENAQLLEFVQYLVLITIRVGWCLPN